MLYLLYFIIFGKLMISFIWLVREKQYRRWNRNIFQHV